LTTRGSLIAAAEYVTKVRCIFLKFNVERAEVCR